MPLSFTTPPPSGSPGSGGLSSTPTIDPIADDSELCLEVWTQAPVSRHCHGHVILEGSDLLRQCYRQEDKRAKRAVSFRLIPQKRGSKVLKFLHGRYRQADKPGSLKLMLFLLIPVKSDADRQMSLKKGPEDPIRKKRNEESELAKKTAQAPIEAELGSILVCIERGATEERRAAVTRLADLALLKLDDITDIFLSQGAVPVIIKLLADTSLPADRRDGAAAVRGLFRGGSKSSCQKLLGEGILPHLLRQAATTEAVLGDASHEGFCAVAELLDPGAAFKHQALPAIVDGSPLATPSKSDAIPTGYDSDCGDVYCDDGNSSDSKEMESIPSAIVDELFSICEASMFVQALLHGATRTKPAAARILAALAGTSKGAEHLIRDSQIDAAVGARTSKNKSLVAPWQGDVVKVLLDVANSGPNQASEVKSDCLRGLFGLSGGENPIQSRCAQIERAGGLAVFGE